MLCTPARYFQVHSQVQIPSGFAMVLATPYAAVIIYLTLTVSHSQLFLLLPARLAADVPDACLHRMAAPPTTCACCCPTDLVSYKHSQLCQSALTQHGIMLHADCLPTSPA
jgi:hypothetical protein